MVLTTGFENQPCSGVLHRLKPVREFADLLLLLLLL